MPQNKSLLVIILWLLSFSVYASELTVEERRLESAEKAMSNVVNVFTDNIDNFKQAWMQTKNYQSAKKVTMIYFAA